MALKSGTHLGPYEILAPLGAGGMGEVYRARDTRLGREVAVKVLPADFAKDADRLRRFEQEARAAGVLNHANILAIYDVGSHEGSPFVVSELLEGQTLRQRLAGGPLPQRKAIDTALEIAHGLAAAHGHGIVHRDLKPENIFITKDGQVKILDFGLAKLTHPEGSGEALTELPTTPSGTEPGVVMGTVGYMSPEQVRGQPADHRSDIFAFGAILYEMLAGRRAFRGDSSVEIMHAILKEEPPEFEELKRHVSPGLDRVVRRCLEKDAEERFQSARDLGFALEAISGMSGETAPLPAGLTPVKRLRAMPVGIALALLVAVAIAGYFAGKQAAKGPPPTRSRLTFRRGTIRAARFAPDGQTIVYGAAWEGKPIQLFSTRLGTPESRPVGLPDADILAISRSGEMAISLGRRYFFAHANTGMLARVSMTGGAPREILENVQEADWSPDGERLAVVHQVEGRNRLEFPVGKILYETSGWISSPRTSPNANLIAFADHPFRWDDGGSVAVVDLAGNRHALTGHSSTVEGVAWSPDGHEVWYMAAEGGEARALFAVSLSGRKRVVFRMAGSLSLMDISRDGRVLVTNDNWRREIMALPPGESQERDLSWLDWSLPSDLSSDGKTLLFSEEGEGTGAAYSVWMRKTDGSPAVRLGDGISGALSPDGRWATAFTQTDPSQIVLLPTGPGESRVLERGPVRDFDTLRWLPDGKHIFFAGAEPGRGFRVYVQDTSSGPPRPISPEGIGSGSPFASPDGKFVAARGLGRAPGLYPVNGGEPLPISGIRQDEAIVGWSADSRFIYVVRGGDYPARIHRLELASGRRQLWKEIAPQDGAGVVSVGPIFVAPDGRAYFYSFPRLMSELYLVDGLK